MTRDDQGPVPDNAAKPGRRARHWGRALAITLATVIAALAVGLHAAFLKLHHSLPQTAGSIVTAGLNAPVEVLRDRWGVPHIFASDRHDAVFAQGFVHAQDRLWQMEFARRTGRGRLAEIMGAPALTLDRAMRAGDVAGLASRLIPTLPEPTRQALEAYAAGVNAYLSAHKGPWPPEFALLGVTPEPWTPEDSIILIKLMALQLCGNGWSELFNAEMLKSATPELFAALHPDYPPLPRLTALYETDLPKKASADFPAPIQGASNNWAVDGRWTKSGKPLLANDPHLGLTIPSVWYLAHLSFGGRNVIGASLAGVPGIILGRNDHLAWAYTNTGADVEDLYLEKISPETPEHYISAEGQRPFTTRNETIKVRGGTAVTETYRATAHGPVLPADLPVIRDLVPAGYVMALDWDALKDGDLTIAAGLGINEADDGTAFVHAIEPWVTPMQNMVYADAAGHIGLVAPGHVPIRAALNDTHGLLPAPGWKPGYDWTGPIPFADLPRRTDPPEGYIVTANNKIVGDDYPYFLTYEWDRGARARRIEELLTARHDHDVASFETMQRDDVSLEARALLPKMLAVLARAVPAGPLAPKAQALLKDWNGAMTASRPEPLIFAAWILETGQALTKNAGTANDIASDWGFGIIGRVLDGAPAQRRFCGGSGSQPDCDGLLRDAFDRALARLAADHGDRPGLWRWGTVHKAVMENHLSVVPVLGKLLNREVPSDGGADTINRGQTRLDGARPFANTHGSTYRAIYDMGEPGNSVFMISTGQSGNPLSRHYDDLVRLWAKGLYIPMTTGRAAILAGRPEHLNLLPGPKP